MVKCEKLVKKGWHSNDMVLLANMKGWKSVYEPDDRNSAELFKRKPRPTEIQGPEMCPTCRMAYFHLST